MGYATTGLGSSAPAFFNLLPNAEEADAPAHENIAEEAAVYASDGKQFVAEEVVEQISVSETVTDIENYSCDLCNSIFKSVRALRIYEGRVRFVRPLQAPVSHNLMAKVKGLKMKPLLIFLVNMAQMILSIHWSKYFQKSENQRSSECRTSLYCT